MLAHRQHRAQHQRQALVCSLFCGGKGLRYLLVVKRRFSDSTTGLQFLHLVDIGASDILKTGFEFCQGPRSDNYMAMHDHYTLETLRSQNDFRNMPELLQYYAARCACCTASVVSARHVSRASPHACLIFECLLLSTDPLRPPYIPRDPHRSAACASSSFTHPAHVPKPLFSPDGSRAGSGPPSIARFDAWDLLTWPTYPAAL